MIEVAQILGPILSPSGNALAGAAFVGFQISGFDTEQANLIVLEEIRYPISADGSLPQTATLWKNSKGLRGTFYRVNLYLTRQAGAAQKDTLITLFAGNIQVGDADTYLLADLLNLPVPDAPGFYPVADLPVRVVTETEYRIAAADKGWGILTLSDLPVVVTFPNDLPVGFTCTVKQGGAGSVSFLAENGGTLRHPQNLTQTNAIWSKVSMWVFRNNDGNSAEISLFGDLATPNATVRKALGYMNVFDTDGRQRTFSQLGDFSGPTRVTGGAITAIGPDPRFPLARIEARTVNYLLSGYQFEAGSSKFAVLCASDGQSLDLGATDGGTGTEANSAPPPKNIVAPLPGRALCFNGGIVPRLSVTGSPALSVALDPSSIAAVVDAHTAINPLVQRELPLYSSMLMIADALHGTDHVAFACSLSVGSSSVTDRLIGFEGSRAEGTVSINGTTATISVASFTGNGLASVPNLILTGPGIAPDTTILSIDSGSPIGVCSVTVSIAQTVGPVAFETRDQKPQQYKNWLMALDAFAVWARSNGFTPIMPHFQFVGGEADNTSSKATAINKLKRLLGVVDDFTDRLYAGGINGAKKAVIIDAVTNAPNTDINHSPSTNNNNNFPSLINMGRVSFMTIAAQAMAREVDATGARISDRYVALSSYALPADFGPRVHLGNDNFGSILKGEDIGLTAIQIGNGIDARWPSITSVKRTKGSLSVDVNFSEPCEFDTVLVTNPGQYGFTYTGGGVEIAITSFQWIGSTLKLSIASEPTGDEVLSYACDNATLFVPALINPVWPHVAPEYGLADKAGQRGNVRSVQVYGYSLQTGRPMNRPANQDKVSVEVNAGTGTVRQAFTNAAVTPAFLLDFGDAVCYPGSGQTATDRSPAAARYWLGIDATASNDPEYISATPGFPAWLRFDGGGGAGVQSDEVLLPEATPNFLENLHKVGGEGVLFGAIYLPSAPPYTSPLYLLANCQNDISGQAGTAFRVNTGGQPGFTIRGEAGATVLNYNMPTPEGVIQGWNVFAIGVQEGLTGWSLGSNGSRFKTTINTFACNYLTPSASAAEGTPRIGMNLRTTVSSAHTLINGAGLACVGFAPWTEAADFLPIFRSICGRLGLPTGPGEA